MPSAVAPPKMKRSIRGEVPLLAINSVISVGSSLYVLPGLVGAGLVERRGIGDAAPGSTTPATVTDKIDTINSKIVEQINASGRAYLTQTKLRGRTVMRIGLGNALTTEQHLRNVWELIRQTTDEL